MGILYFCIHFIIEVTSFYILSSYTDGASFWSIALLYDYLAFVPQGIFGYLGDRFKSLNFAYIGISLALVSLLMFQADVYPFVTVTVLASGNAMVHIEGASSTLRASAGRLTPAAVFVSGGSFGVICGKLSNMYGVPFYVILLICISSLPLVFFADKIKRTSDDENLSKYDLSGKKFGVWTTVALAVAVVAIRAYMGYGIPTTWNKTVPQTVMLYCSMGIGKALGGILTDRIGIRKTIMLSTVGALPFLVFGDNVMTVSLIGVMLFSMTMAVTLGIIVSKLRAHPGVAFGFTTLGLFLGTLPVFFVRVTSTLVNCVIVTALTALSATILSMISKEDNKK